MKPIERFCVSATDDDALIIGFNNLQPGSNYETLADSADARAITDLLVGDTLTIMAKWDSRTKEYIFDQAPVQEIQDKIQEKNGVITSSKKNMQKIKATCSI